MSLTSAHKERVRESTFVCVPDSFPLLTVTKIAQTMGREVADQALGYLIVLSDVNTLYDLALGLYDFTLVVSVAQQSHKDPKEYLPFLRELQALPETIRKYRIDMYLR